MAEIARCTSAVETGKGKGTARTKDEVRALYAQRKAQALERERAWLAREGGSLARALAGGDEVVPEAIEAEVCEARPGTREAGLFRLAMQLWSVPPSGGFGRRKRFIVRDRANTRLIGIIGTGDPVFNLSARERWVGWTLAQKKRALVRVIEGWALGAVPPYDALAGGKLVAALATAATVRAHYDRSAGEGRSIVLLTTAAALGRSSMYNRLRVEGGARFERMGWSEGYGHFHIPDAVFERMRARLEAEGHDYARNNRYGAGPNWKLRVIRQTLDNAGVDGNACLAHGVRRELWGAGLCSNWRECLHEGGVQRGRRCPNDAEVSAWWRARWGVPRARRRDGWRRVERRETLARAMGAQGAAARAT